MTQIAGPLGTFISYRPAGNGRERGTLFVQSAAGEPVPARTSGVNGVLLLRRAAWVAEPEDRQREAAAAALRAATADALDRSLNGELLRAVAARRAAAVARLASRGREVRTLRVRPAWRLVVGLGEPTPGETGMSLHGTYGIPVLPGQTLKGLARNCARASYPDAYADYGTVVFGAEPGGGDQPGPASREAGDGRVMFLDALPEHGPKAAPRVSVDVMNPHVPGYYGDGGASPPAEHAQPVPVGFCALTSAAVFTVHLVGRGHDPDLPELALTDEVLLAWLTAGLTEDGLGAKTNAGYGYLVLVPDDAGARRLGAGKGD